jgi:hypothetical protein
MALRASWTTGVLAAAIVVAALWYLRDPSWLASYSSGFHPWETAADGRSYRWTKGHASFFVPSDAQRITLPLRSLNDTPQDWPITATITIDDRVADRMTFRDETWHELAIRLPGRATRRVRRIDITVDRVRTRLRGVQVGKVEFSR